MSSNHTHEMIEMDEACAILKCTPEKLADELRTGGLPGTKVGREWIIPRTAFYHRLNERALEEAEERRSRRAAPPPLPTHRPAAERRSGGRRRPLPVIPSRAEAS